MSFRERSLTLLTAGLLTIGGCRQTPVPIGGGEPGPGVEPGQAMDAPVVWPFWPKAMRVHPLSRLVREGPEARVLIEARVEFFDTEGDTTKGLGEVRINLHEAASAPWDASVADWSIDLRDVEVNQTHFDDITTSYLFRLEVTEDQLPDRPQLRVYFLGSDGAELTAEMEIRTK